MSGNTPEDAGMQIIMVGPPDSELTEATEASLAWTGGEPLPHLSKTFDSPLGNLPKETWKELLLMSARSAPDAQDLAELLLFWIGRDLVYTHGVPEEVAEKGVTDYAEWLFTEYH